MGANSKVSKFIMGDVSLDEKAGRRGLAVFIHFQGKYGPLEQ